ncbi:MAG: hypothetical protein WCI64_10680 [Chlorobium sp.]
MVKKVMITNRRGAKAVFPITELGVKPVTDTPVSPAKTHEVAEYENWFLQEVEKGLTEADDPDTRWVSEDEANRSWEKKRSILSKL